LQGDGENENGSYSTIHKRTKGNQKEGKQVIPELKDAQKNTSYQQINYIFNKIKSVKSIIIACATCVVLTYLATSYVIIKYGSMLWGEDSVISLRMKNDAITKEASELKESLLVLEAVAFDDVKALIESESSNPLRRGDTYGKPHAFTFSRWSRIWRSKLVERAIQTRATNILTHITKQENWFEKISDDHVVNVNKALNSIENNTTNKPLPVEGKFWWSENTDFRMLTKQEREEIRLLWQTNRAAFKMLLDGDKLAFAEMIDSLPNNTKATWGHFQEQLKGDEEGTLRFIKNQYEEEQLLLKNKDKTFTKNAHEITEF